MKTYEQLAEENQEMLEALDEMLDTYAPYYKRTIAAEGEHMLIACVRKAIKAIAKAQGKP